MPDQTLWVEVQYDGSTLRSPTISDDLQSSLYDFVINGKDTFVSKNVYLNGTPLNFDEYGHLAEVQEVLTRPAFSDEIGTISADGFTGTYNKWFSVSVPPGYVIPDQFYKSGQKTAPILGDPLDPTAPPQDQTTARSINDILNAYNNADPAVQASIPPPVINTLETIGQDAQSKSPLVTPQTAQDAMRVDGDLPAAQNASDPSDPAVQKLEKDVGTLLTDWSNPNPNFVGPTIPPSSPPVGSPGDYGQGVPYNQPTVVNGQQVENLPSSGHTSNTDELGNPLPIGISRGLPVSGLSESLISQVDTGLKEKLPTIETGLHQWQAANNLPSDMTINAGTNGHGGKTSLHNIGTDGFGHAIDIQLPTSGGGVTPLTPTQLQGLVTTLRPLLPEGYRIGLSVPVLDANGKPQVVNGKPVTTIAPGADFPDQTTSIHVDDGNVSKLNKLKAVVTTGHLQAVAPPVPLITPTTLQTPPSATFIASDDEGVVVPSSNLIDSVTALATDTLAGPNGMADLNAIFANAKLIDKAAFAIDAPIVDNAFAKLVANATQAQATAVFVQNGLTGFAENGITPAAALVSSLKNLIG